MALVPESSISPIVVRQGTRDAAATAWLVDGSAVTQPVSIAGAVPVTGGLTDVQLRATPVPVSGTVATGALTDTQLRASAVPISLAAAVALDAATLAALEVIGLDAATLAALETISIGTALPAGTNNIGDVDVVTMPAVALDAATLAALESITVTGPLTDVQLRAAVVPVGDGAGSLTVDAPVGTPLFARLSDGAAALIGQKAMAASLPVALASDQGTLPALSEARAATLHVTATAGVNTALTLTLPQAGAGLFHYITSIQVVKLYSVIGVAAGAGVIITSTNLPGGPAWTTEQLASAAGTVATVLTYQPSTPLKSAVANTATTIVCPQQLQTIWRVNVSYFTAV